MDLPAHIAVNFNKLSFGLIQAVILQEASVDDVASAKSVISASPSELDCTKHTNT